MNCQRCGADLATQDGAKMAANISNYDENYVIAGYFYLFRECKVFAGILFTLK